jgi:acetyl-CoA carboxylase carboxyl transferase subunit beta
MNWLTNYVRPKIRALYARKEVPDNLWYKCPTCEAMLFHRDLEESLHVCQHCGFHMRLSPERRLALLFDAGEYQTIELPKSPIDPLKFRDQKRYTDRLKEAQSKTGRGDAIIVAHGRIGGMNAVVAAFDFGFMGGSMGMGVGDGILTAAKLAVLQQSPLIVVPASGGARMQEGILSLMQMPRSTIGVEMVKDAGLPYIVVLTDPTTGGVTASFAMLGDVHIAERGAQIGFAGARVIESTIRETLPEGFQRSEYLMEHGMVDMVVHRRELRPTLIRVIDLLMRPRANDRHQEAAANIDLALPLLPRGDGTAADADDDAADMGAGGDVREAVIERG